MTQVHSFSIYLLKNGFDATNSLKDENKLQADVLGNNLPEGAILFVLDNFPHSPWWKSYFGIQKDLMQVSKGALIFVTANERWFALSFGHVSHNLKDTSYEYDFGLRVTLNCVDPEKLKSTDILEPSGAKRQRTQLPVDSDLTYFDFDRDSTILKTLTGKVKDQYKDICKNATGASNIRISSDKMPAGLADLCGSLLELYQQETYKTAFPDIQNISPVRDPEVIENLNVKLVEAFKSKSDSLTLSVPEIQNYGDGLWGTFSGAGAGKVYDDIFIARYYEYLADASAELDTIGLSEFKKHHLALTNEEGSVVRDQFSILKCMIFDTMLDAESRTYHLCEGNWYLIDADYVTKLTTYLDPLCKDTTLPNYIHANEGDYNESVSLASNSLVCLDKTNIAPNGQKHVEPCDIYELADGTAIFHHVKISTLSAQLSHLFNQGTNSIRLLRSDAEAMGNLQGLVSSKVDDAKRADFLAPLIAGKMKVVFEIVTHKDKAGKSLNLPLFSRISLRRCMRDLKLMAIETEFTFVANESPTHEGKKKKRKPKGGEPA